MNDHFQFTDVEFEQQFEVGALDANLFTHEAHIRLAWIHIKQYGEKQAISNIEKQLIAFVTALGAKDKYHKTVTIAAVKVVNHFVLKSESDNFKAFITEFPRLKTSFKELLAQHYGIDLFNFAMAKSTFVEPDILPFD